MLTLMSLRQVSVPYFEKLDRATDLYQLYLVEKEEREKDRDDDERLKKKKTSQTAIKNVSSSPWARNPSHRFIQPLRRRLEDVKVAQR